MKNKILRWFLGISAAVLGIMALALAVSLHLSASALQVTEYRTSSTKITEELRIVQLSDLHDSQFGQDNCRLVEKVTDCQPDLILMSGDMLSAEASDDSGLLRLIQQLSSVAPVYFSLGNHELEYMERFGDGLTARLESAGAVVVEQEYRDITVKGQALRIGGLYGYALSTDLRHGAEQEFLLEFEDTDDCKLLLSHLSEGLLLYECLRDWDIDLVFSGHTHGGMVRVPFVCGLFTSEEGYFPTYTKGFYELDGKHVSLSAGLGQSGRVPRINNIPQIVLLRLEPGDVDN